MTRARDLGDFIADGAAAELVVDTTTLVVDSTNNRVGIGTASPATALDVVGNATITTADNTAQLTLVSTDADANAGPILKLRRNSASPADNDLIGAIDWTSENSSGDEHDFLNLTARMRDVTAGSEDVAYAWTAYLNGTGREIQSFVNTDASAASMVFNEDSQDIDFRVESNGNANMLFVDGGNNAVGIGTSNPVVQFAVGGAGRRIEIAGTDGVIRGFDRSASWANIDFEAAGYTFDVSGSEVMRVTSDGDVGIGASNPGGSRLYLQDTHTATVTDASTLIGNTTLTINGNSGQGSDVIRMGPMGANGAQFIDVSNASGNAAYALHLNPVGGGSVVINNQGSDAQLYLGGTTGTSRMYLARSGSDSALWNVSNGSIKFGTNDTERFRFGSSGQLGIGGATYGTSGQVLTSGGASAAPTWADAGGGAYEVLSASNYSSSSITLDVATDTMYIIELNKFFIGTNGSVLNLLYSDASSGNTFNNRVWKGTAERDLNSSTFANYYQSGATSQVSFTYANVPGSGSPGEQGGLFGRLYFYQKSGKKAYAYAQYMMPNSSEEVKEGYYRSVVSSPNSNNSPTNIQRIRFSNNGNANMTAHIRVIKEA